MAVLQFLSLWLLLPFWWQGGEPVREWVVISRSTLVIDGQTNVNQFQCASLTYSGSDVLYERKEAESNRSTLQGAVVVQVTDFDCYNKFMTQDLQKTLQAQKYPTIKVRFVELQRFPKTAQQQNVAGVIAVELVGVSRSYNIKANFVETGSGRAVLQGSCEISFSDFGLTPPSKMMGAIKVNDCLGIRFKLELEGVKAKASPSLAVQ